MQDFKSLKLKAPLLRAITELGFEKPSPIQAETLPILLGPPTDFLGLAATGTGKTAAFSIPLLTNIEPELRSPQALVLCPTRELALQVAGQIDLLGKYLGISSLPIYGGTGYRDQLSGLKAGATVVVGTPGRIVDHIEKGTLDLSGLKVLVLDEADEMISMGFKEDLEAVLKMIPSGQAKTWLFSATMSHEVRRVADTYLNSPQKVQVNRAEMLPGTVEQVYYLVHERDKPSLLSKLIDAADDFYGIVFCQTKALVIDLTQYLAAKGYKADCLHGDMDQTSREKVMRAFREKSVTVLIATDVACRGLDVKDITHVINYSLPREMDNYVHRIGRTGRSGKAGLALSLVTDSHRGLIRRIEQMTKSRMKEGRAPSLRDIAVKKTAKAREEFEKNGPQGRMSELLGPEWKALLETLSKEEIVGRFITLMHPELAGGDKQEVPLSPLRKPILASPGPKPVSRPAPSQERQEARKDQSRTPPWEKKRNGFKKKSTPWGSSFKVKPAAKWEKKKKFSAKEASEGKQKRWDSRPSKQR